MENDNELLKSLAKIENVLENNLNPLQDKINRIDQKVNRVDEINRVVNDIKNQVEKLEVKSDNVSRQTIKNESELDHLKEKIKETKTDINEDLKTFKIDMEKRINEKTNFSSSRLKNWIYGGLIVGGLALFGQLLKFLDKVKP